MPISFSVSQSASSNELFIRFNSIDLEAVATTVEAALEETEAKVVNEESVENASLLSTDAGYFNFVIETDCILLLAADVESRTGMEQIADLLKKSPDFVYQAGAVSPEQSQPVRPANQVDDTDYNPFDDDGIFGFRY